MSIYHRKLFIPLYSCYGPRCVFFPQAADPHPHPPPPPPPPNLVFDENDPSNQDHYLSLIVILIVSGLSAAFLLVGYLTFVKKFYSRRWNPSTFDDDYEDFVLGNHGPVLAHPTLLHVNNTVGLQQSVIDSIQVFKYKSGDVLIEGTECSVCLNEFQEDEILRLLPKCRHAFHIPCIDTWLRSHENCPLCRARVSAAEPNSNGLGPREETPVENLENYGGTGSHQVGEDENNEHFGGLPIEEGTIPEILTLESSYFNKRICEFRVLSDLADHRSTVEEEEEEEEEEVVRRSISMDASSGLRIYHDVAYIPQVALEGCSSIELVQETKFRVGC